MILYAGINTGTLIQITFIPVVSHFSKPSYS